jgi:hypothetical protein
MKRLFLTAALGVVCIPAFAQGTLNFANSGLGLVARVYDTDGTTGLAGSAWSADLYWASGIVANSSSLMALSLPATFSTMASQAGLFFGGPRTIPGAAGGTTITAQVRVWNTALGSSWATAAAANMLGATGESILFQVILADPSTSPTTMTGLNGHPWTLDVPEPSKLALVGLGLAGMLLQRRRNCEKHAWLYASKRSA